MKSDFREGITKFFNKNSYDSLCLYSQYKDPKDILRPTILEIMKEPNSYCLRERLTRETADLRKMIERSMKLEESLNLDYDLAIKIVSILVKNIPNYLILK